MGKTTFNSVTVLRNELSHCSNKVLMILSSCKFSESKLVI
ncbi:hypothetical protein Sd1012_4495 [Shigella dysenteriae 1012]|nr:hypothetical protein Sd1012_4495 [Shigella dysenteriae 1012]